MHVNYRLYLGISCYYHSFILHPIYMWKYPKPDHIYSAQDMLQKQHIELDPDLFDFMCNKINLPKSLTKRRNHLEYPTMCWVDECSVNRCGLSIALSVVSKTVEHACKFSFHRAHFYHTLDVFKINKETNLENKNVLHVS